MNSKMSDAKTEERRLFGTSGAEYLESTLAAAYERHVEPYYDLTDLREKPVELEEWTVSDNRTLMPPVGYLIEHVVELIADNAVFEEWYDEASNRSADPAVVEAFQNALNVLADKIQFWMADKKVGLHWVTAGEDGTPLIDGEPIYVPSKP